jgi:hypothetical protein
MISEGNSAAVGQGPPTAPVKAGPIAGRSRVRAAWGDGAADTVGQVPAPVTAVPTSGIATFGEGGGSVVVGVDGTAGTGAGTTAVTAGTVAAGVSTGGVATSTVVTRPTIAR